jgi:phosphate transport system protein
MHRHVDTELQELKQLILEMGGCVEKALSEVCQALFAKEPARLKEVHNQEARVNDLQIAVDQACVRLLAKQAPVAKDLRFVIATIKINTDLERMCDQAVNIAHCASDLFQRGTASGLPSDLVRISEKVRIMVRDSLDAFVRRDVNASHGILERDDEIDELKDKIIVDSIGHMRAHTDRIEADLEMIIIAKNFERLADHATNIAEEVIFMTTGDDVRHGHTGP